jgi:diphthamide biosynthesis protein 7
LLSLQNHQYSLITGSYDENLRIFDTRSIKNSLNEINLGGGIWRIKSDPLNVSNVLCACMYHNFSIVSLESLEILSEYNEHESICYGCDWSFLRGSVDQFIATCSFYDHKLCLSKVIKNI